MNSTYTQNGNYERGSEFDDLDLCTKLIGKGVPAYVLGIRIKDDSPQEIERKLKAIESLEDTDKIGKVIRFKETLDLVVESLHGEKKVKQIACRIYRETESPVAIVPYQGQDVITLSGDLILTLNLARVEGKNIYMYNPEKDSAKGILQGANSYPH